MTTKYITENQWTSHLNLSPTVEETVFILSKYHFMERSWNARNPPTFPTRAEPREGLPLGLASSFWCPREQQGVLGPGRDMSCSAYTILQQTSSCTLGKITILNSDFSRGSSSKGEWFILQAEIHQAAEEFLLLLAAPCWPTRIPKIYSTWCPSLGSMSSLNPTLLCHLTECEVDLLVLLPWVAECQEPRTALRIGSCHFLQTYPTPL